MNRTCRLPQELVDMIIDHFYDNIRALKLCSLVCKAWVQPCRYHLFFLFTLDRFKAEKFIPSGLALLSFSRSLWFDGEFEWTDALSNDHFSLLGAFKNIRSLAIGEHLFNAKSLLTQLLHANQFANIVLLHLYNVDTYTASQFAQIICACSGLEKLIVNRAGWYSTDEPLPTQLRLPRNLHYLGLKTGLSNCVLEWLISVERKPALRTLFFMAFEPVPEDEAIMRRSLQMLAPTLEAIGWSVNCSRNFHSSRAFDLSHNTALRFVYFDLDCYQEDFTSFIISTLRRIVSQNIERVAFKLWTQNAQPDCVDWRVVDTMLMEPKFSGLRMVEFCRENVHGVVIRDAMWLSTRFPLCHARHLLKVADGTPRPFISDSPPH